MTTVLDHLKQQLSAAFVKTSSRIIVITFLDDSGIVRHAMTTSLEHEETARNCLDIVAMLKQSKVLIKHMCNDIVYINKYDTLYFIYPLVHMVSEF